MLHRLPTHERTLDNGLTVLVREDHSAPVVAIVTHVKAGYFDEPDRLVGISHVLEHMYFKGTERRGVGEIARETKAAGGYLNAGTIYDYTSYYTVLPSSALAQGLDIQADALRNSQIDEDELRRELRVIIQEAKRKLDMPASVAAETLYEEMFDVHRMRRWRIGTEDVLEQLERRDVWEYYRNLYRPSNIVLAIAGDVDPDHALALVEREYGGMPAGEVVRDGSPEEPERTGFRYREMAGDIAQSYLEWGWRTPGTLHPDTPALDLLAVVLGQGRASRLYRSVREAGWVTGISAYHYTPTEVGVFGVSADLSPEEAAPALEAIGRAVATVRDAPVTAAELERARNMLEARLLRRTETAEGQANLLAQWQALGDWRLAERYLEDLRAATPADLHRAAREYLDLERATVLLYRPDSAPGLGRDAEDAHAMLRTAQTSAAATGGIGELGGATRPPAPGTESGSEPARAAGARGPARVEDDVHLLELPTGVRVAVLPRHSSPLVTMGIAVRGGSIIEPGDQAGLTRLMARTSLKGTETRDARTVAEEAEALGGAISPSVSADGFSWTFTVPSRHFEHGLDLLADTALRPVFPVDALERERKTLLSELEQLRDDMYRYPMRLLLERAFRGHPYGTPLSRLEEAVRGLGAEDLRDWHQSTVLDARPWILVVGDVEPERALDAAARVMAPVRGGGPEAVADRIGWPAPDGEHAERRNKAQTAFALGFPGPARNDDDVFAIEVLSNAISGLGGRLFDELRDRRSLAYTVTCFPLSRWVAGAIIAYIATAPEREAEAREALLEQFERLAEQPLSDAELERAKRYTIGAWKIRSQTNAARLGDLASALLLGDGLAELREFEDRILEVTPEAVRDAMRRYFDPERIVTGIVRGTGGGR